MTGKGGVGKTTTAALLALAWARSGRRVHLVSTDPAHSTGDVFGAALTSRPTVVCVPTLVVEEPDADARAAQWLARIRDPLGELLERGSYLDREDIERFTALRLPGIDEVMAALRLVELLESDAECIVVDTAPTGHTLRLLDAGALLESWTAVLDALADKSNAVAGALFGARVHGGGDELRGELGRALTAFRERVLEPADFVVVTRTGEAVRAETERLEAALGERRLRLRARIHVGAGDPAPDSLGLPWLDVPPRGCEGLAAALDALAPTGTVPAYGPGAVQRAAGTGTGAAWLDATALRLLVFAGKGGVGKSTCAAAAAVRLARSRPVLLLGVDPAGSLGDVLAVPVGREPTPVMPGLRAVQIDARLALERWRRAAREEASPVLDRLGLGGDPSLDRRVFEAIWNLAPPGLDEITALAELIDVVTEDETVVLDTAPTGHFLRLLELPAAAQEWTRAVMRMLLKYGVAGELDAVANRVVAFARQLKKLRSRLADAGWTGAFIVTLTESLVEAETRRLVNALDRAGLPLAALLTNRHTSRTQRLSTGHLPSLRAPLLIPPPRGVDALGVFAEQWEML